jgi:hypothetical protein
MNKLLCSGIVLPQNLGIAGIGILVFRIEVSFSLAYGDLASDFLSDVV